MKTAAKSTFAWSVWGRNQVHSKIKSKAHPTSPTIGPKRIVPDFGRIKPRYTGVCLLCLTFTCFLSCLAKRGAVHSSTVRLRWVIQGNNTITPPCAPRTNADVRRDPLHPPPRHIRATHVSAPPPRYIDTAYRYQFAPVP